MKYVRYILMLLLLAVVAGGWAQVPVLPAARHKAVYGSDWYVSPSAYDYTSVARAIVGDASSNYEKAERLYMWLCDNVTYDHSGAVRTADGCWAKRTAVCQGYCELFFRMGQSVGLSSRLVFGRCKHAAPEAALEDHTWLEVDTEEGAILLDPTWGGARRRSGRGAEAQDAESRRPAQGEFVADPMLWFDVDPAWLIFTHLPKNHYRQHLQREVGSQQFADMPYLTPHTALLGLSADDVLARQLDEGAGPPHVVERHAQLLETLNLVDIPPTYRLRLGEEVTFVVDKLSDDAVLQLVADAESYGESGWTRAEPDGSGPPRLTLTITPQHAGRLSLALTPRQGVPVLRRLVDYVVE